MNKNTKVNKLTKRLEEIFLKIEEEDEYVNPFLLQDILNLLESYDYETTDKMWEITTDMFEM